MLKKKLGKINSIINCAYSGVGGPFQNINKNEFDLASNLNVLSPIRVIVELEDILTPEENAPSSSIINIASIYGIVSPSPHNYSSPKNYNPIHYGASKAAMIQATRYLACFIGPKGIRVNSISPGAFPNLEKNEPDFIKKLESNIPLGRVGLPEDLVGSVLFLVSDASSYINGTNIIVDGGWTSW